MANAVLQLTNACCSLGVMVDIRITLASVSCFFHFLISFKFEMLPETMRGSGSLDLSYKGKRLDLLRSDNDEMFIFQCKLPLRFRVTHVVQELASNCIFTIENWCH